MLGCGSLRYRRTVKENRETGRSRNKQDDSAKCDSRRTSESSACVINKLFTRSGRILADSLRCHTGDPRFEMTTANERWFFFGLCLWRMYLLFSELLFENCPWKHTCPTTRSSYAQSSSWHKYLYRYIPSHITLRTTNITTPLPYSLVCPKTSPFPILLCFSL